MLCGDADADGGRLGVRDGLLDTPVRGEHSRLVDLGSRLRSRSVIDEHDGASGARLERAVLDDGARLILKVCNHETDLSMLIPGRIMPLDVHLWQEGHLDRLPEVMGHAVRGAWQEDAFWVLAMDDLGDRLLSYRSVVSKEQCRQILAAACAMHDRFAEDPPSGLWSAEDRMTVFAPRTMQPYVAGDNPLPGWCLRGWERFDSLAPPDVRDLVYGVHQDPRRLAQLLADLGPTTLLHGDYWTPNLAPAPGRVVAIDWALATSGSPAAEFVSFLVGCGGQVQASKDEILSDITELWAGRYDGRLLTVALVLGLVEMGWNLSLAASEGSPAARAEWQWWVEAARRSADTGLIG